MISEYGTWPSTLNDYVSMRESLTEFQKIVSINLFCIVYYVNHHL